MNIAYPSDTASGSSLHYFAHIVKVKFVLIHLLTELTKHACQHNSFGEADVLAVMPHYFSKAGTFHGDFGTYFSALTSVFSEHTSSLVSDLPKWLATFSISDTFPTK